MNKSSRSINTILLGCGVQGQIHLNALKSLQPEGVNVTALCDISAERLNEASLIFPEAKRFSDYREALKGGNYELAIVATMPNTHADIAISALESGAHVLCEKPFAFSTKEVQAVLNCASKFGRQIQLGTNMRYMPGSQYLQSIVKSGTVGTPVMCRAWGNHHSPPLWTANCDRNLTGGGVLACTLLHGLDLALWVAGSPTPISVTASSARLFPSKRGAKVSKELAQRYTVEDLFSALIRFDNQFTLLLEGNWCSEMHDGHGFELITSQGTLSSNPFRILLDRNSEIVDETPKDLQKDDWAASVKSQDLAIIKALQQNIPWSMHTHEELKNLQKIIDACYESANLGQEIKFD